VSFAQEFVVGDSGADDPADVLGQQEALGRQLPRGRAEPGEVVVAVAVPGRDRAPPVPGTDGVARGHPERQAVAGQRAQAGPLRAFRQQQVPAGVGRQRDSQFGMPDSGHLVAVVVKGRDIDADRHRTVAGDIWLAVLALEHRRFAGHRETGESRELA
jgi:hypothetical protein